MAVNVQTYTSMMDAFLKDGGPQAADMVFSLFDEMQAANIAPTAVTYGCLLLACRLQRRVDLAFSLYQQACDEVLSAALFIVYEIAQHAATAKLCTYCRLRMTRSLQAACKCSSGSCDCRGQDAPQLLKHYIKPYVFMFHNAALDMTLSHCFVGRSADGHVPQPAD